MSAISALFVPSGCQRPSEDVELSSGHHIELISIGRGLGMANILGDSMQGHEAVVVSYYLNASDSAAHSPYVEAREVVELGIPLATQLHDSLIVIKQTSRVGPRWSPFNFEYGRMYFFRAPRRTYAFAKVSLTWEDVTPR
ncbi:MAG: hypothetical protein ABI446_09380 [Gemmatimonadaceae bacterium]